MKTLQKNASEDSWKLSIGDNNLQSLQKMTKIRSFGFTVENCPKSLKLIVQFGRFLGLSFSGVSFSESKLTTHAQLQPKFKISSLIPVILNLCSISAVVSSLFAGILQNGDQNKDFKNGSFVNNFTITGSTANRSTSLGRIARAEYARLTELKPILRYSILAIRYIFFTDLLLSYIWNGLIGGKVIQNLILIGAHRFDHNRTVAVRLLLGTTLAMALFTACAVAVFNQPELSSLYRLLSGFPITENDQLRLRNLGLTVSVNYPIFVSDLMVSLFFLYSMMIYEKLVKEIQRKVHRAHLDSPTLYSIKHRLLSIVHHYQSIISYFSLPITLHLITNTIILIGSSCFLIIINQSLDNTSAGDFQVLTLVLTAWLFACFRLVALCYAGNLLTNQHRELMRLIYEQIPEWDLSVWMGYLELRRVGTKFRQRMLGGVYIVRQSAILSVAGFALNYIVVLLQTENYVETKRNLTG